MPHSPSHGAEKLDPVTRLALAYAPDSARPAWEALIFFNLRLEETAKPGREPLMIQLRLAWWRDRLSEPAGRWPKGEPLLAMLKVWEAEIAALISLVDGWEASVVGEDGGAELTRAQVDSYVALARLLGEPSPDAVWLAASDLVARRAGEGGAPILSRAMRPLAILRADALRSSRQTRPTPLRDLATLVRVGLLGR